VQGETHWQTQDARRLVQLLEEVARLPAASQAELAEADKRAAEAETLARTGRHREAIPLLRQVLATQQRHLGPAHLEVALTLNELALYLNEVGSPLEAEPLYRRSLAVLLKVLGVDHPDTAGVSNNLAANLYAQGQYTEAELLARRALAIKQKVYGEDHPDTATSYDNVALNLHAQGKYALAEPLLQRALTIRQKTQGEAHSHTATSYLNLGMNLNAQAKYAAAEPMLRLALAICQKTLGENHPQTAASYNSVATNLSDQGKHADAEPLYRRALAIRQKARGEDHPSTAAGYNNLANNLTAQAKYVDADPLYRRALAILQKVLGEGHPQTAAAYNNLAHNLNAQGKYTEAEVLYARALTIRQKALGEDHPSTAESLNNLALNLHAQGRYAEAEPLLRRALAIKQKVLGEIHPSTATGYNNLAINLETQGKHGEAEALFRRGLVLTLQTLGRDHPDSAGSYNNLAAKLYALGRYGEAEPLYRRALAICLHSLGEDHPNTAASYNNVATVLKAQGKYALADPLYRRALAIDRKMLGEDHPFTAGDYTNLASNLDVQGKHIEAEPLGRRGLAIHLKVLGEEHVETAQSHYIVGSNLHAQGRYVAAETSWAQAAQSFDAARLRGSPTGLERASLTAAVSPRPALAACQARLGQPLLAWQSLEAGLARGLLDDLSAGLAPDLTPAERQRQQTLTATLTQLDRQVTAWFQLKQPTEADRTRFQELAHERQVAQAELDRLAAALTARQVYGRRRIQEQLPADAAWVAWVDVGALPNCADANSEHWACVLRHRGDPAWVRLPGSGPQGAWTVDDDDLLGRFRLAVASPPGQFHEDREELTRRVVAQRLAPLGPVLGARNGLPLVRQLVVCPVWRLAGVPLEALTDQYTVSYIPSGTLLAKLAEKRQPAPRPGAAPVRLLAVGDPAFGRPESSAESDALLPDHGVLIAHVLPQSNAARAGLKPGDILLNYAGLRLTDGNDLAKALARKSETSSEDGKRDANGISVKVWRTGRPVALAVRPGPLGVQVAAGRAADALHAQREGERAVRASQGQGYARLPGTRLEVQAIVSLFDQPLVLLDTAASAPRLADLAQKDQLRPFRYLHFATHGEVNPHAALQSALILAPDPRPGTTGHTLANPPALDSRLAAAQMLRWKLDADLVTLSACQSGLGKQAGGEGFLGFAQALFLAGARSVLVSLWKVDDTATALLMTRFYQNLLGRRPGLKTPLPKAEALREAKLWLRDLTASEIEGLQDKLQAGRLGAGPALKRAVAADAERPYAHPHYWAAFILIGDPQ
jgi:tetratricopeptide (TPR) repeat protein